MLSLTLASLMLPADGGDQLGAQRANNVLRLLRAILPDVLLQQHGRLDAQGELSLLAGDELAWQGCWYVQDS